MTSSTRFLTSRKTSPLLPLPVLFKASFSGSALSVNHVLYVRELDELTADHVFNLANLIIAKLIEKPRQRGG